MVSGSERREKSWIGSNSEGSTCDYSSRSHSITSSCGTGLATAMHTACHLLFSNIMTANESLVAEATELQTCEIVTPHFDVCPLCTCVKGHAWLMVL